MAACIQIIANIVVLFCFGLFVKNYFPSYMKKKGENLATKEDIKRITEITEGVKKEFEENKVIFSKDLQFKYKFYYDQYDQLYSYLYACVVQSEYIRHYLHVVNGKEASHEEFPYIQISPRHKHKVRTTIKDGTTNISTSDEDIETPISQMNFDNLVNYIISNGALANQNLLKYALAYRIANEISDKSNEKAQEEMMHHQTVIVNEIVKNYNSLRKELKMSYNADELENGFCDF